MLAYQFLGFIMLGDARYDRAFLQAIVDTELKQLIRFRNLHTFQNRTHTDIQFHEIIELNILTDRFRLIIRFLIRFLRIQ